MRDEGLNWGKCHCSCVKEGMHSRTLQTGFDLAEWMHCNAIKLRSKEKTWV